MFDIGGPAGLPDGHGGDTSVGALLAGLAVAPGSPAAVGLLAGMDPAELTGLERVDLVVAWERQIAWMHACQLTAVAALEDPGVDERPSPTPLPVPVHEDGCREELAAALHLSAGGAQHRLELARALSWRLAGTAVALRAGDLSVAKAGVLLDELTEADDSLARAVEARVLPAAARQTPGELGRAIRRALLLLDPGGAAERATAAAAERRVSFQPLPAGMGGIWAELPAADALTVLAGLDTDAERTRRGMLAAGIPAADIPRLDARRADALLGWARRALTETGLPTTQGRPPHIAVTVPIGTLLGVDDQPGELAGYGPIDSRTARRIAAEGTWRRLLTDPVSGALLDCGRTVYQPPADLREFILTRDPVCVFPGCLRPSRQCQIDHITPWEDGGTTSETNTDPKCLRHHHCRHQGRWNISRDPSGTVTWTSPTGKTYTNHPPRLGPECKALPDAPPPDEDQPAPEPQPPPPPPTDPEPPPPF